LIGWPLPAETLLRQWRGAGRRRMDDHAATGSRPQHGLLAAPRRVGRVIEEQLRAHQTRERCLLTRIQAAQHIPTERRELVPAHAAELPLTFDDEQPVLL